MVSGLAKFGAAKGAGPAIGRAFVVSIALAVLMVLMAIGFMSIAPHFISSGDLGSWLIVPLAVALAIFALSFVVATVLLDRAGTGQWQSIAIGGILALGITVLLLTFYGGLKFVSGKGVALDDETLLAGFALALIAGAIVDRLVLKI